MESEPDIEEVIMDLLKKVIKKLPLDSGNYPYVCARVRAKKTLLYPSEMYQKFLQMSPAQISRTIGEGEYKSEILAFGIRLDGAALVETATRENMTKTYIQVSGFCEGSLRSMIYKFIARWDVWNIQTILRGKSYGASSSEIVEALIPAGAFDMRFLKELIEKETMGDIIDALEGTEYYDPICNVMEDYEKERRLAVFEEVLIHAYYYHLLEIIPQATEANFLFLKFIKMEIDMLNLRMMLRLKLGGGKAEAGMFVDGGLEISADELEDMLKLDWSALTERLRKFTFYDEISKELKTAKERGLNELMRTLEKHVMREATRHANIHPLSILPVLDYLLAKKNEVDNIRIIARGKEDGLDNETIKSLLVMR